MYRSMYKFVFLVAVILLVNSACGINAECIGDDGPECILDEECCSGYCDWKLSYYPYTGGCAPRPSGPIPPKPCIPLYTGQTCVYNVTCCQGYCERRYTTEGFCVIGAPPGFPPVPSPAPNSNEIAPITPPISTTNAPTPTPVSGDLSPTPLSSDPAPTPSPNNAFIPGYDGPISAPIPSVARKKEHKKKRAAPAPSPLRKNRSKRNDVAPIRSPSKKDAAKRKHVAPTPAPSRKVENKKKHTKHENKQLECTRAHAPSPA